MNDSPAIKLSALTSKIQQALHNVFAEQTYWVVADVTNHSFYQQKGYHYFDLVEKDTQAGGIVAKVAAVAWGNGATRIKEFEIVTGQPFKNDIHVLIRVSVSYHQVHGLQIALLDIDTSFTIGMLEQQKQQTLLRLTNECADFIRKVGDRYVTKNNQLPLPAVIQRLAVITSGNSAGYQDFRHTLEHNHFGYTFIIDNYFTVVQGEAKAELVQQRLIDIYSSRIPYDAVVIIRGGGAPSGDVIGASPNGGIIITGGIIDTAADGLACPIQDVVTDDRGQIFRGDGVRNGREQLTRSKRREGSVAIGAHSNFKPVAHASQRICAKINARRKQAIADR